MKPILGIKKDLSVGLPDSVVLHPFQAFGIKRSWRDVWLQIHQAPLQIQLQSCSALEQARGSHAGAHLHINQIVRIKGIGVREILLPQQVIHQPIALLDAQSIVDAAEGLFPGSIAIARTQNSLGKRSSRRVGQFAQ